MTSIEQRLTAIEARLAALESSENPAPEVHQQPSSIELPLAKRTTPLEIKSATQTTPIATQLLGWGGATALVLAASYMIKLALNSGWLTPERQIVIAVLDGLFMIGAGLRLQSADRNYASLLPAGGVTILFVAVYAAHLYHGLLGPILALSTVALICVLSLWLCNRFQSTLYALFAVVGAYSVPFLISGLTLSISDLVIYYICWSVLFSVFSVWVGSRAVYLLALYMSLIGFDWSWHSATTLNQWVSAVSFQTLTLVIFAITATLYSLKQAVAMTQQAAQAHLPALLIYYFLQYNLLNRYVPEWAPWIAVASAMFILVCYAIAKKYMKQELAGGKMLLQAYVVLVLFHAGYIESVSATWAPWVAFILLPLVALYAASRNNSAAPGGYIWAVVIIIFMMNYLRVVTGIDRSEIMAPDLLSVVYALELYAAYYLLRKSELAQNVWQLLLVAGHVAATAAAVHIFDSRLLVSISWGVLALTCLMLALHFKDKLLGKSSLLIFAFSAGKVLIYDLSSSAPLIRIGSLLVVGLSLYLGGWLYKKIEAL